MLVSSFCHDARSRLGAVAALSLAFAIAVAACGLLPEAAKDETAGWSAEKLYSTAHLALAEGNFTRATQLFETLESRYPYGRYAQQAILEGAYANYRGGDSTVAIAACDRFIRTYPNFPTVDYAYYLKGLAYFREDQGLLGYVYELDLSEREPKSMRESYSAFKELLAKFPNSRYANDAQIRMRYLTNALATYEVKVARYYFNRGAYVAALNRAQAAVIAYPRTPATEDALDVMVKSYEKLGLVQLRDDTERVMRGTYPESAYLGGGASKPWWRFW